MISMTEMQKITDSSAIFGENYWYFHNILFFFEHESETWLSRKEIPGSTNFPQFPWRFSRFPPRQNIPWQLSVIQVARTHWKKSS